MASFVRHAHRHQKSGAGLIKAAGRSLLARTFRPETERMTIVRGSTSGTCTDETSRTSQSSSRAGDDRGRRSSTETATDRIPLSDGDRGSSVRDLEVKSATREKILSNTVLSREHLTPEIALHLITPDCDIYHRPVGASASEAPFPGDPFWGFFWPGGQALTRYVLDSKPLFRGKSVLDVGCGCGASSIAAKLAGASSVTANDIDEVALLATLLNARVNGITGDMDELELNGDNLIGSGEVATRYDIVLIGDLFYDMEIAEVLHPWIHKIARAGKKIFIGDPGRHGITETGVLRNMTLKACYELPKNVQAENIGFAQANVWQYTAV